ncbi:hypothetical protein BJY00DRAFT_307670 [Aspergillus carlsbadensis]|nr:hypothetical protein BJY00DRAFT_307670 [Aspergillus carlsbadensis]
MRFHLFHRKQASAAPPELRNSCSFIDTLLRNISMQAVLCVLRECDRRLEKLQEQNELLSRQLAALKRRALADSEKIQRLNQLAHQAREADSQRDNDHRKERAYLYSKLHAIQMTQDRLCNDQVVEQMSRLRQQLENWVKSSFKHQEKLAAVLGLITNGRAPRHRLQRYAYVQASLVKWIHHRIFAPYMFGVPNGSSGSFCEAVELAVQQTCPEATLQTWRVATSSAIQRLGEPNREEAIDRIIGVVNYFIGNASSLEAGLRNKRLREILQKCADFKDMLSRQPDRFAFRCSKAGDIFRVDSMTAVGGVGEEGNVEMCLWPGLVKRTYNGDEGFLERELVWTTKEAQQ